MPGTHERILLGNLAVTFAGLPLSSSTFLPEHRPGATNSLVGAVRCRGFHFGSES